MAVEFYRLRRLSMALMVGLVFAGTLAGSAQTLAEALNTPNLIWTTGGDAPWLVQTTNTHDGAAAVQTPRLGSNQTSWIETTVSGPGTVRIWQKAIYANGPLMLRFTVNGTSPWGVVRFISGSWNEQVFDLGEGTHVLRWTVDGRNQTDSSAAIFLDEFAWDPPRPLALNNQPWDSTVYSGASVWLSASAIGTPPFQFQWRRDGTNLLNATNTSLNWAEVTTNDAGVYSVVVSNTQGFVTSSNAILTVLPSTAPFFTAEPADVVVYTGGRLNLSASMDGSPAVYQWRKNGLDLPNQNWHWLQLTNVSLADAGSYTLFASNAWGSIESSNVAVTVLESIAPTITRQPRSLEVASGVTTCMSVAVTGTPDLAVVWSGPSIPVIPPGPIPVVIPNLNLPGNEFSYFFRNLTTNDAGVYFATASNSGGAVTSQAALLTVLPPIEQVGTNSRTAVAIFVTNGLAYLARGTNGFSILNVSDPAAPVWLGDGQVSGSALAIQAAAGLAFVATGSAVEIFSVTNPAAPILLSRYLTGGSANDLVVRSNLVFVANGNAGLAILDASNPASPKLVGSYATNLSASHICLAGKFAYLTGLAALEIVSGSNYWVGGLLIVDVSDPAKPVEVKRANYRAGNIAVSDQALIVDSSIISTANPAELTVICSNFLSVSYSIGYLPYLSRSSFRGCQIVSDHLYLIDRSFVYDSIVGNILGDLWRPEQSVLLVYDIREPSRPTLVGQAAFYFEGEGRTSFWADGQYVYIAGDDLPLKILKTPFTAEPELPPQLALTQPGGFKLQMNGHRGRHCAVEYSEGLTGLPWQTLQTVMLTNDTVTVPVSSSAAARFFRLRQLD